MSFTPGPWHVSELDGRTVGPVRVLRADGDVPQLQAVARVMDRTGEWQANARLIAAAPELLQALRDLVDDYEAILGDGLTAETAPAELRTARAAIAKAEGRP